MTFHPALPAEIYQPSWWAVSAEKHRGRTSQIPFGAGHLITFGLTKHLIKGTDFPGSQKNGNNHTKRNWLSGIAVKCKNNLYYCFCSVISVSSRILFFPLYPKLIAKSIRVEYCHSWRKEKDGFKATLIIRGPDSKSKSLLVFYLLKICYSLPWCAFSLKEMHGQWSTGTAGEHI